MAQKFLNGIDVLSTAVVDGSNLTIGSTALDVQGTQGQLFSVTNSLTGDLFSVSDISGLPIFNVNSNGNVDIDGKLGINNNLPAYSLDIDLDSVDDRINITAGGAQKAIINGYGNGIFWGSLTSYNNTLGGGGGIFTYKGGTLTQTIGHKFQHLNNSFTGSSGDQTMMQINPVINQTSTAGYTGIKLNVTESATGSGTKNLLDLQVGGSSKFTVNNEGSAVMSGDLTIDNNTPRIDFKSDQSNTNVGGRIELNENGNLWVNAQGGKDLWLNWYSPHSESSKADLAVGDGNSGAAILFVDGSERKVGINDTTPSEALDVNGNIAVTGTVDGVDISTLPTTFAPTDAEANVQPDWNATSGDAQILNKLNREFKQDYWGDDRFVRAVTGTGVGGADTGDKWVHLSNVDIAASYEKVKIEFTIGSYDDNARGDERIAVLYENHSTGQEGHILHWYKGDQIPTLFKAVKSIRSASSGLSNTYDLYVQIDGAWKDSFTVHAEWWKTHTDDSTITYPTTVGGSTPTAGDDDKSLTSRERWVDADMLDGYHLSTTRNSANTVPVRDGNGYLQLGWINTTSGATTATINKIYVSDDNYIRYITPATFRASLITGHYLPLGGGILTGDLKLNAELKFQRDGANYSNYIRSQQYISEGYDDSNTPANDRYWLEYGAKGGHHFVVNTDGGAGAVENAYDDFTIWQGAVDGDRLFEVTNVGNASLAGNLTVGGNLVVEGSVTTLNTATIEVEDNILQLNTTQGTPDTATATTSGISIYRGDGVTQASLIFDDGDDVWDFTNKLKVASSIYTGANLFLEGSNPYIRGTGTGAMRIKHTAGQTMYIRPDETGTVSFFEGANSQSVYMMTQTPTVDDTSNESAKLSFHTRSKQADGTAVAKYATIKHRTHNIGNNYTTLDFSGSDKSKFNMPIEAAGGLYYTGDAHMGFIPHPRGAQYRSDSSTDTGYILIKLPTDVGNTPDDMMSFYVDIYDYTTNEMVSVFIGGYIYRTTGTAASYWYNCTAIINTKLTAKDFTVRFGNDGTNFYVAIGETNSVWSHPSIVVRDFQCSYRGNVEHYIDGWAISTETTSLTGVDETQTGNLPQAKNATTAGSASSVPYTGLTGTVPTWNQDTTGSSASCTGNAASSNYASDYSNYMLRRDNRTISPNEDANSRMRFGFTSWNNNNTAPYADYLHMRSYSDSSGGQDNLVMFKKEGIGMRIWQHSFNSSTAYSNYENVYSTTYEHKQENTDVDSGAARTIASVDDASFGVFFDFLIKKGSNVRAGTLTVCHDGTDVEFAETSTVDIGDTTEVVLTAVLSGGNVVLQATTQTNDWSIKSLIRAL